MAENSKKYLTGEGLKYTLQQLKTKIDELYVSESEIFDTVSNEKAIPASDIQEQFNIFDGALNLVPGEIYTLVYNGKEYTDDCSAKGVLSFKDYPNGLNISIYDKHELEEYGSDDYDVVQTGADKFVITQMLTAADIVLKCGSKTIVKPELLPGYGEDKFSGDYNDLINTPCKDTRVFQEHYYELSENRDEYEQLDIMALYELLGMSTDEISEDICYLKVTDECPAKSEISGLIEVVITYADGPSLAQVSSNALQLIDTMSNIYCLNEGVFFVPASIGTISKGIYLMQYDDGSYAMSVDSIKFTTFSGEIIKIDEKFLPELPIKDVSKFLLNNEVFGINDLYYGFMLNRNIDHALGLESDKEYTIDLVTLEGRKITVVAQCILQPIDDTHNVNSIQVEVLDGQYPIMDLLIMDCIEYDVTIGDGPEAFIYNEDAAAIIAFPYTSYFDYSISIKEAMVNIDATIMTLGKDNKEVATKEYVDETIENLQFDTDFELAKLRSRINQTSDARITLFDCKLSENLYVAQDPDYSGDTIIFGKYGMVSEKQVDRLGTNDKISGVFKYVLDGQERTFSTVFNIYQTTGEIISSVFNLGDSADDQVLFEMLIDQEFEFGNGFNLVDKQYACSCEITFNRYMSVERILEVKNSMEVFLYLSSPNYLPLDGREEYTPSADYQPATKKYVDEAVSIKTVQPSSFEELFSMCLEYNSFPAFYKIEPSQTMYFEYKHSTVIVNGIWYVTYASNLGIMMFTSSVDEYKFQITKNGLYKTGVGYLPVGNLNEYTPTTDYSPATKKYVDDAIASQSVDQSLTINPFPYYKIVEDYGNHYYVDIHDLAIGVRYTETEETMGGIHFTYGKETDEEIPFDCSHNFQTFIKTYEDSDKYYFTYDNYFFVYNKENKELLTCGFMPYTDNTVEYTPTDDYNPATKKYVDDAVNNIDCNIHSFTNCVVEDVDGFKVGTININDMQRYEKYILSYDIRLTQLTITYTKDDGTIVNITTKNGAANCHHEYILTNMGSTRVTLVEVEYTGRSRAYHYDPSTEEKSIVEMVVPRTNTTAFTPTEDYNLVHKKYVDDAIANTAGLTVVKGTEENPVIISDLSPGIMYKIEGNYKYTAAGELINPIRPSYINIFNVNATTCSYVEFNSTGGNPCGIYVISLSKNTCTYHSLVRESQVLTKSNTTEFTPTNNYHPATKKYVDDAVMQTGAYTTDLVFYFDHGYESSSIGYVNVFDFEPGRRYKLPKQNSVGAMSKVPLCAINDDDSLFTIDDGSNTIGFTNLHDATITVMYKASNNSQIILNFINSIMQVMISVVKTDGKYSATFTTSNATQDYHRATKKYVDDAIAANSPTIDEDELNNIFTEVFGAYALRGSVSIIDKTWSGKEPIESMTNNNTYIEYGKPYINTIKFTANYYFISYRFTNGTEEYSLEQNSNNEISIEIAQIDQDLGDLIIEILEYS